MKQKLKTIAAFVLIGGVAFATMWFITGLSDPVIALSGLIVAYLLLLPPRTAPLLRGRCWGWPLASPWAQTLTSNGRSR